MEIRKIINQKAGVVIIYVRCIMCEIPCDNVYIRCGVQVLSSHVSVTQPSPLVGNRGTIHPPYTCGIDNNFTVRPTCFSSWPSSGSPLADSGCLRGKKIKRAPAVCGAVYGTILRFSTGRTPAKTLYHVLSTGKAPQWAFHHVFYTGMAPQRALYHVLSTGRAPQVALSHIVLHIGPPQRALYHVLSTIGASKRALLWRFFHQ